MTMRWVGGGAFAALLVVLASAAYIVLDGERRIDALTSAAASGEKAAQQALATAHELRASQQAYVGEAQSPEWWHARVESHLDALGRDLGLLRQFASDPGALNDMDAAVASLDAVARVDERALQLVLAGRRADASLLIFSEGAEAASGMVQRIESARATEASAVRVRVNQERRAQGYTAAGAAVVALAASLLLLVTGHRRTAPSAPLSAATEPAGPVAPAEEPVEVPAGDTAPSIETAAPAPEASTVDRRRAIELHEAAGLCTDLARVLDAHELPGLLGRGADLLDASGLIVWLADANGVALRPSLTHGYSAAALARLPAIERDADNATAATYRRAELHAVAASGGAPGAIVVPLLNATGCVGVLAAEVRNGREASEPTRAIARILAAQIASLVGPGPAREEIAPGQQAVG
jgi:hypothetical protein